LWLGIANLICSLLLGGVYGAVFKVSNLKEYFIYLSLGFSIWTILGGAINSAPNIFDLNANNIKNSSIHPLFYVLEDWAFQIQNFIQSFLLIIIFITFLSPNILINFLIFSPIHLLNFFLFLLWLPLLICIAAVKFQDLYQLVPILTQLIFLLSPIIYLEKNLGDYSFIAEINPLYQILSLLRNSIINGNFLIKPAILFLSFNVLMIYLTLYLLHKKKKEIIFYI
jgi:lipopolysaccharide transport system permease protein